MQEADRITIESPEDLRHWLEANHATSGSVWLVRYRKSAGDRHVSWSEAVDELLCYGWVDSLPRKLDAERTMIRISPRNPKSNWSGINKEKVERLRKEGRMTHAGEALIVAAKANGCWTFLDDVEQLIVPADLGAALAATENAAFYYHRFPDSGKRAILEWIKSAKTDKTRAKRIRETVELASRNVKANHPNGRDAGPAASEQQLAAAERIIGLKRSDLALRDDLLKTGALGEGYHPEMAALHARNAAELDAIIETIGYPTDEKVGREASDAAWLVVQHAIGQPDFMRKCARLIKDPLHLAYLTDRIATLENRPQRYGTQFDWDENGELSPQACDDVAAVDERRKALGLNSLAEQTGVIRKRAREEGQAPPADLAQRDRAREEWKKQTGWLV